MISKAWAPIWKRDKNTKVEYLVARLGWESGWVPPVNLEEWGPQTPNCSKLLVWVPTSCRHNTHKFPSGPLEKHRDIRSGPTMVQLHRIATDKVGTSTFHHSLSQLTFHLRSTWSHRPSNEESQLPDQSVFHHLWAGHWGHSRFSIDCIANLVAILIRTNLMFTHSSGHSELCTVECVRCVLCLVASVTCTQNSFTKTTLRSWVCFHVRAQKKLQFCQHWCKYRIHGANLKLGQMQMVVMIPVWIPEKNVALALGSSPKSWDLSNALFFSATPPVWPHPQILEHCQGGHNLLIWLKAFRGHKVWGW